MYGLNVIVWLRVRFRLVGLMFCWWVMCFGCGFRFMIWYLVSGFEGLVFIVHSSCVLGWFWVVGC